MRNPLNGLILLLTLLMVHATLYPYAFSERHSGFLHWAVPDSRGQWLDMFLNFYFFLPLGVLAGIRFRDKQGMLASLVGASLLSLTVEVTQSYIPGRYSSLRDVFLNSLGAASGMVLAHLPLFDREMIDRRLKGMIQVRGFLLLGVLRLSARFFPFVPRLRMKALQGALEMGLEGEWLRYGLVEGALLNGLMVMLVASVYGRMGGLLFSGVVVMLSPMEVLVWAQESSLAAVSWGMVGALVSGGIVAAGKVPGSKALAMLCVAMAGYRQLEPFVWETGGEKSFSWIPFAATFAVSRDIAMRTLALKCFLYWHTLRQLCLGWGWSEKRVAAAMAAGFFVTEWTQKFQAGRTPEITDSLLCLMGGLSGLGLIKAYNGQRDSQ